MVTQIRRGVGLAAAAALAFGATVPLLKRASGSLGVFTCGALLYLGAAAVAGIGLAVRPRAGAGAWDARALGRLLALALLGAVCAPALLVAGVKRTDAVTTSLLLTLEAPFTILLAWLLFREHIGRRALVAAVLVVGGALLAAGPSGGAGGTAGWGAAFVAAAMLTWALDNILSRTLADRDPLSVVAGKGLLGGLLSAGVALLAREPRPPVGAALAVAGVGAVGYGVSMICYLRAQVLVGAARTASVFAVAPFVGSVVALAFGAPWPGLAHAMAAGLMLAGVWLHASERHRHRHHHHPIRHEHLHTHDDGHHTHVHDPMPAGPHSHAHDHEAVEHEHEHSEDIHHRHHDH